MCESILASAACFEAYQAARHTENAILFGLLLGALCALAIGLFWQWDTDLRREEADLRRVRGH